MQGLTDLYAYPHPLRGGEGRGADVLGLTFGSYSVRVRKTLYTECDHSPLWVAFRAGEANSRTASRNSALSARTPGS